MPIPDEIDRAFASGATIITANARAARWLQREYALRQRQAGRRAWASPPIMDWEIWLRQQWQAHTVAESEAPLLLTSLQERSVWKRMQSADGALVVSPENMAKLAESAYALLSDYKAHAERNHAWSKTDAERFRQWSASFDRECARGNWIPRAGLEQKIAAALDVKALPGEFLLVGFERTTPAQDALLETLRECGVHLGFVVTGCTARQTSYLRGRDLRDELTACAEWARKLLEESHEQRIGILVPDLGPVRAEMERVFRRVLMPQSDDIFSNQPMPFEFSLGQPLADTPVIRAALLMLRWVVAPLREEETSWLLLSGFVTKNSAERLALARLDAKARNSGRLSLEIPLEHFLKAAAGTPSNAITNLENAHRAAQANRISDEERLPGRWTDICQLLLREAGWPGTEHAGTLHHQAMRRWERALDDLALLDFDGRLVRYRNFLEALEALAQEMIFAPESQGAPIQVMGAFEASGQQFDAVWLLGANDANWPSRGGAHPLLPNDLQGKYRMPYSTAATDLELAKAVTEHIAASAPLVVFSHAAQNQDGELRPSPLLPADAAWQRTPERQESFSSVIEIVDESSGRIAWPSDRSPGGSEVLRDQAACPFRAFATRRLRAEPLNRREWGLSASERGKLLHKSLEIIWSPTIGTLHSLADLRIAIREGRLEDLLRTAIAQAFADLQQDDADDPWMHAYLQNEQRRLLKRLTEWMEIESERVPFTVIACEEKLHDVSVGGLKLKLRADRIDAVADGDRLLIDYKSGKVSIHDWDTPRPNEPQLPLYAVFGNLENVRGALFARIRAGEACFTGSIAELDRHLFADRKPTSALGKLVYDEPLRDEWQDALLVLAADFRHGEVAVDPKRGKKTCEYCSLPGLCRVAESGMELEDSADTEDNDRRE